MLARIATFALVLVASRAVPAPTPSQLAFMEVELSQFMHFGIPTFWDPPLSAGNFTYHDCFSTAPYTNDSYAPCLNPDLFQPRQLDPRQWMKAAKSMGIGEICLTAQHEGGFALWPSNFTDYGVAASSWRNGKGDVLREFADAANEAGIKICYYLNAASNGYLDLVKKLNAKEFLNAELGMLREVLTTYGPVYRLWFDGTQHHPGGKGPDVFPQAFKQVFETIRSVSPNTLISPYRGDICTLQTGTVYTFSGPETNTTDPGKCSQPQEGGNIFKPIEAHGVTMQQGPDGHSDALPTYWFYHPRVGYGNASRYFEDYIGTQGRGQNLLTNIPPDRTGLIPTGYAQVMSQVGIALNSTFGSALAQTTHQQMASCGVLPLALPRPLTIADFDYIVTQEDMIHGQRIGNYSIEYRASPSSPWRTLVPPVLPEPSLVTDPPAGHSPRDSHVGYKRIDTPLTTVHDTITEIRLRCLRAMELPLYIRNLSVHKKSVPW